ncbi:MAG: DUF2550 domain-containing protein [Propionibacteriaceae bacterium]|nr:DUF2550 domain-containing protein [Propionibacteriaceae bacterium]
MDWLGTLETLALVCLCLLALMLIVLLVRRYVIISHGGVFDCGMRRWHDGHPGGWAMGMARYSGNLLKWYRMFALIPRHSLQLHRDDIVLRDTRRMDAMEALQLFDDQYVVELKPVSDGARVDLSMSQPSLLGLSSWLEAAPIGHGYEGS